MKTGSDKVEGGPTVEPMEIHRGDEIDQQTHENEEVQLDKDEGGPEGGARMARNTYQQTQDEDQVIKDKDTDELVWEGIPEEYWPSCDWCNEVLGEASMKIKTWSARAF